MPESQYTLFWWLFLEASFSAKFCSFQHCLCWRREGGFLVIFFFCCCCCRVWLCLFVHILVWHTNLRHVAVGLYVLCLMYLSGFRCIYRHTPVSYVCLCSYGMVHQPIWISPSVSIVCVCSCVCPSVSLIYLLMFFLTCPKQLLCSYTYAYGCSHCRSPSLHCKLLKNLCSFIPSPKKVFKKYTR